MLINTVKDLSEVVAKLKELLNTDDMDFYTQLLCEKGATDIIADARAGRTGDAQNLRIPEDFWDKYPKFKSFHIVIAPYPLVKYLEQLSNVHERLCALDRLDDLSYNIARAVLISGLSFEKVIKHQHLFPSPQACFLDLYAVIVLCDADKRGQKANELIERITDLCQVQLWFLSIFIGLSVDSIKKDGHDWEDTDIIVATAKHLFCAKKLDRDLNVEMDLIRGVSANEISQATDNLGYQMSDFNERRYYNSFTNHLLSRLKELAAYEANSQLDNITVTAQANNQGADNIRG